MSTNRQVISLSRSTKGARFARYRFEFARRSTSDFLLRNHHCGEEYLRKEAFPNINKQLKYRHRINFGLMAYYFLFRKHHCDEENLRKGFTVWNSFVRDRVLDM